jgi:hypothetical protein
MSTDAPSNDELVPFFTDKRTISEKLTAEERKWIPTKPAENCPATIAGLVLERGSYDGDYDDEPVPTVRLLDRASVVWSVLAFHGYLRTELERKNPQPGDYAAFAYLGKQPAKREGYSDAHDYRVVVERNPDRPEPPPPVSDDEADAIAAEQAEQADDIPF